MSKLLILAFFAFRFYMWIQKNKKDNPQTDYVPNSSKKSKGLDDVLGDFLKDLNDDNYNKPFEPKEYKPKPVLQNTDTHKAESDSDKTLDWQAVSRTKIIKKEQLINRDNYKNISHRNKNIDSYKIKKKKTEEVLLDIDEFDLEKAVIYKEVLERKYFSI